MQSERAGDRTSVRYEPDDKPPTALTVGLGLQLAILCLSGIVLTPAIVVRAAGGSETYLAWAVFAAVAVSGITTVLQAVRVGRIGADYVLLMGTSGAFIAVSVTALAQGGPAMLATLVVISALFQFVLAARLSLLRRVLTPTVAGTVIMLIAVTVMPIVFDTLKDVPENAPPLSAPLSALVTVLVMIGLALKATGALRLWAPVIGVVVGSVVAGLFGIYDLASVAGAAWIGVPARGWPGFDLSFGPVFWALLPAFVFVTLVGAIETIGDGAAIQRVSWRRPRAVDFRAVQGAVSADGAGNLLSGLAGTVPNTTYSTSGDRAHRGRSAQRRGGHRGDLRGAGVPAQGARRGAGDSGAGGRGLHHRAAGDAVRHRDEDGRAGRHRLPQGTGGRCFVLGRSRLPERRGLPRVLLAGGRRAAAERHDGRRLGGHSDDAVHGADRASPPPDRGGNRPLGPAEDQGVPRRIRVAQRLGRGDGRAARRRRRGDAAVADRSGRGRRAARTAAPTAGRAQAGWRGGAGVRRLHRAREPAGPDRVARPRGRPRSRTNARRRSGSCATSPRRFATSSTTARKS